MYDLIWGQILDHEVARIAMPLPWSFWQEMYSAFDDFVSWSVNHPNEAQRLDSIARTWRQNSGLRLKFSGYFSPYYRNRVADAGKDRKQILQFCAPFFQYLMATEPSWLAIPQYRVLAEKMMVAILATYDACLPIVDALAEFDDVLARKLMPTSGLPPLALRLLRYESDGRFNTNPHVDKSALTVILHTDDASDAQCLVFAPAGHASHPSKLSEYSPVEKSESESILFVGAAPQQAGHPRFRPAAHAVRPCESKAARHSTIFFWLLPEIDMDDFDTTVPFTDDLGSSRPIAV